MSSFRGEVRGSENKIIIITQVGRKKASIARAGGGIMRLAAVGRLLLWLQFMRSPGPVVIAPLHFSQHLACDGAGVVTRCPIGPTLPPAIHNCRTLPMKPLSISGGQVQEYSIVLAVP